jgi:competence protein ComEA
MIGSIRRRRASALLGAAACLAVALAAVAQAADSPGLTGVVNVNTASLEELQLLPGIGESRAQAMVELRKRRGGFKSLEELKEVKGIGDASLDRLRPYVRLQGKTTAALE